MNINLKDKNALVCGASKGIGKACAITLASLGANVTLVSRSAGKMGDVLTLMSNQDGQDHDYLVADFENLEDLTKKMRAICLNKDYHILINNSGGPAPGLIHQATTEQFLAAFNNHLLCSHTLSQMLLPGMKMAGYGRIINIISISVKTPIPNLGVSNSIRAAMAAWAKSLSSELGTWGITVNNVLPGYTDTERLQELYSDQAKKANKSYGTLMEELRGTVPLGRIGRPEEIAAAAAFLASPAASYITGINLPVDGGRTPCL